MIPSIVAHTPPVNMGWEYLKVKAGWAFRPNLNAMFILLNLESYAFAKQFCAAQPSSIEVVFFVTCTSRCGTILLYCVSFMEAGYKRTTYI